MTAVTAEHPHVAPLRRLPPLAVAAWAYPVLLALVVLARWLVRGDPGVLSGWLLLPSQLCFLWVACAMYRRAALAPWRRIAWQALIAAAVLDVAANALWTALADTQAVLYGTFADVLFVLNYVALVVALASFYKARRASFRSARFVTDALTLMLGIGASLIPFILSPALALVGDPSKFSATIGYTLGIGATAIMGTLIYTRVMDWRTEHALAWILAGIAVVVVGDLATAVANMRGMYLVGGVDVIVSSAVYTFFTMGAYAQYAPVPEVDPGEVENVYGFLPVLSVFVALAIMLGAEFNQSPANLLLASALTLTAAVVLAARQFRVRLDMKRLDAALAAREAEARVSELVRRSADLVAVVSADRTVRYLSPAAERLLGRQPDALVGRPARTLFGEEHSDTVDEFLTELAARPSRRGELELPLVVDGETRIVHLTASDESGNGRIEGIVLNVRDLTEQRDLERALLDIATRERERLCGDIHEGLGQQLTGIGLYLRSLSNAGIREGAGRLDPASLDPVIKLVSDAVDQIRALARGFSPLEVVHRSFVSALRALAADAERQFPVGVRIDSDIDATAITDAEADHLYRIIQEAVLNACRHAACRNVTVRATVQPAQIAVEIRDDGVGLTAGALEKDRLGLRMMRYRAQLLGATIRFESAPGGGTAVSLIARRRARSLTQQNVSP